MGDGGGLGRGRGGKWGREETGWRLAGGWLMGEGWRCEVGGGEGRLWMGLVCGGRMGGQDGVLWAVGCPGSVYLIPTSPYLQNILCWRVVCW